MVRRPRLDPEIFHLPVEKMREGYYSDKYFVRTRELLLNDDHRPCVTMLVFGKAHAFLGGIDEAIAILKLCSMEWPELEVYALYDGDEIAPWETVPHALIAAYGGDTVLASKKFAELMDGNMRLITLVDFENDCIGTALKVARALGERHYGVRIDTSETLVDKSVIPQMGTFKPTGVNPQLVWNVRRALDGEGFQHVKIVVSGGFTVEKIRQFEEQEVPVDMYGVGSSLFQGRFDFTADVVRVEGKPLAKVGRSFRPNPRLERVESL